MTPKRDLDEVLGLVDQMQDGTYNFWVALGERLLVGQKTYGDSTWHEKDLDQMADEEIMDYYIYRAAKARLRG
jgi:hypothetical protein